MYSLAILSYQMELKRRIIPRPVHKCLMRGKRSPTASISKQVVLRPLDSWVNPSALASRPKRQDESEQQSS